MKIQTLIAADSDDVLQAENILRSCVHCGLCNATCPTYQLLHNECDGPRGRIYLIKHVLEGQEVSLSTLQHLDRCLTCRACETTCPSGVQYARLLDIGRKTLEQRLRRPLSQRLSRAALCYILPDTQRFKTALQVARLFKAVLPKQLAEHIPISRLIQHKAVIKNAPRKMLLLTGCVQETLAPNINAATAILLAQFNISLIHIAGCCGAISHHNSAPEQALDFARHNIDVWLPYLEQGVECIISTASGCGVMVKDYGELLQYDTDYAEKAKRVSAATRDLIEVLLSEDLSHLKLESNAKIAVQSPCTLQHGQKLAGSVERLLKILGFNLCAVADSHLCCGSAGTYSLLQSELANQLGQNKIANLEQHQPELIATANIGCLTHLQHRTNTPVQHWVEIVAARMILSESE